MENCGETESNQFNNLTSYCENEKSDLFPGERFMSGALPPQGFPLNALGLVFYKGL